MGGRKNYFYADIHGIFVYIYIKEKVSGHQAKPNKKKLVLGTCTKIPRTSTSTTRRTLYATDGSTTHF